MSWRMGLMCRETPLSHSLHCHSNSFISTCPIHHCCHPNIVIHTLLSSHPRIHQLLQLLSFLFHICTSNHQMSNILHLSTSTVLAYSLFSSHTTPSSSLNLQLCRSSSQFHQPPPPPLTLHHKNLISASAGFGGKKLLTALTSFTNLVLSGDTPAQMWPLFFGAALTALNKKDGGVRRIAVGCTLRRLVAKVASRAVWERMGLLLALLQLGFGTSMGAEAASHAVRTYQSHPRQTRFQECVQHHQKGQDVEGCEGEHTGVLSSPVTPRLLPFSTRSPCNRLRGFSRVIPLAPSSFAWQSTPSSHTWNRNSRCVILMMKQSVESRLRYYRIFSLLNTRQPT